MTLRHFYRDGPGVAVGQASSYMTWVPEDHVIHLTVDDPLEAKVANDLADAYLMGQGWTEIDEEGRVLPPPGPLAPPVVAEDLPPEMRPAESATNLFTERQAITDATDDAEPASEESENE